MILITSIQSPGSVHPPPLSIPYLISWSHYFLITQNVAENYQNLETSTIQRENWFWNGSQLIDWLDTLKISRDSSVDWLIDFSISAINKNQ